MPSPKNPTSTTLSDLLHQKGLSKYGIFFAADEGRRMRNGEEEASGFVVASDGRIYSYWIRWDAMREKPVLTEWDEVKEEPHWRLSSEYRIARMRAGLSE
jgi:hypothetical protein